MASELITISVVADVIEQFYYKGIVKSDRDLRTPDFLQYAKFAFGNILRTLYYNLKASDEGDEFYLISQNLLRKIFPLQKTDSRGRRRVDFKKESFVWLPNNRHIFEVAPISSDSSCKVDEIVQVQPGEERFYKDAEYADIIFFVVFGNGFDVYHAEDCIEQVEVTGFYDNPDMLVNMDLAFDILNAVLGDSLKVKGYPVDKTDDNNSNVKQIQSALLNTIAPTQP